jgi:glycerone phosphate O-acyltransferase
VARAKYHAWSRVQQLNPAQAMQRYIALVAQQQDHALGRTVHQEYQAWLQQQPQPPPPPQQEENNSDTTLCTALSTHDSPTLQLQQQLLLWWNQVAILPRGRLDISAFQLAQTALNCVLNGLWNRKDARDLEQLIAQHYTTNTLNNHTNVLVGLSVRSLLDLYLRCRNFTPRSTVLMAPPINIPSILTIFQKHGLQVVGVDLKSTQEMRINVHPLQDLLQQHSNVVALLLVHPFGMRSVTPDDMQVLLQASQKHHFDILEDCAECHGLHPTPSATMSFFSFGMTKIATALGGGVAILHQDEDVAQAMQRMHTTLYPRQSHARYLRKVLQAMLVQCVTASPILYGMLVTIVGTDRWNDFATTWTRNLSLQFGWHDLRQRPCRALLQTLVAQLQRPPDTRKARRAHEVAQHLTPVMPPDASSWWLTPILISTKPHTVAQCLLQYHGMDVPQGNLQCLCNHCPHAQQMMEQVLYVPDNAWSVPKVAQTILAATRHQQERTPTTRTTWSNQTILMGLVALVCTCGSSLCRMLLWLWIQAAIVLLLGKLTFNVGLMLSVGNLYLESSQTFAKYNPMLRQAFEHSSEANPSNLLNSTIPAPKLDNTTNSNGTNKYCVVLTGATGFLGTCILYELLRHCTLEKIIVICRSKKGKTASQRIQDLLHQDMFSLVSDRKRLIMVMEGDTLKPNAGLDSQDLHRLRHDFKVRCVINCAATVAFTQSLEDAAESNITSALYLQKLSRTLKARLVQISTAFVHGGLTGEPSSPLPQTLFSLESFDPRRIYKSMLGNQMFASLAMSTLGFPNTYTFSKCVCEHLLLDGGANDTVIIRPSIIGPALEEPYEGWAGLRPSTIVAATCLYLKYPFCVWCFGNHVAPIIPVDVVARFVVAKSLMNVEESSTTCASGYSSPATSDYDKLSSLEEVDSLSTGSCTTETTAPASVGKAINSVYNVVWNNDSPTSSTFSWVDFATSVPHLGTVLGYISRSTAYLGYLVSLKILPSLHLSPRKFSALYHVFVQVPFQWLLKVLVFFGQRDMHQQLSKLYQFLDLPVLFYPFSNNSFYFESELVAPEGLLGERYLFSCVAAAHRFLYDWIAATEGVGIHRKNVPVRDSSVVLIGGQHHTMVTSDLFWALSQPKGNILVRLSGFLFIKLLRASSSGVSVDVESFSEISRSLSDTDARDVHIILAPTHRSLFDFILVSFIIFSLPELQIHMPFVAAAEEFSELPYFGWLLDYLNAFFITRGRGADPQLSTTIKRIKETSGGRGICIEVFIEGTRSRDRRFLKPKTGFLRCLAQTGGEHLIVPICISYEKIPEQDSLIRESISGTKRPVNTGGLLAWLWVSAFLVRCG